MIARKKRILIITIIVVTIILCITGITLGVLYIKTDLFKSNERLFYKYAFQNTKIFDIVDMDWISQYNQKISSNAHTSTGSITFNGKSSDENANKKANVLNNIKININGVTDFPNQKENKVVSFRYSDKEVFKLEYINQGDLYGLKSDEVVNKYVGIENNKLQEYFTKLGKESIAKIPDKVEKLNIIQLLTIPEESKSMITQKYLKIIQDEIRKEQYAKQTTNQNIQGIDMRVTQYSLTLTENQLDNIEKDMLKQLEADEDTLGLILNKLLTLQNNNGVDLYTDAVLTKLSDRLENTDIQTLKKQGISKDILIKLIESEINKINKKDYKDEKTYTITVYETKGNLIKTEITEGNNDFGFAIEYVQNGEETKVIINTNKALEINDEKHTKSNKIEIEKIKNNNSYKISTTMLTYLDGSEKDKYVLQFNNDGDLNGNLLQQTITYGYNKENKQVSTTKYINKQDFTGEIKIPEVNDNNFAKLNDYSKEDNQNLVTSINRRLEQLYTEKMQLLGIDPSILVSDTLLQAIEFNNQFTNVDKQEEKKMQEAIINSELEIYKGDEISGDSVKAMLDKVKNFNEIQSDDVTKQIGINVENIDYAYTEQNLKAITQNISTNNVYRIVLQYNEANGLVNKILITKRI